MTPAILIPKASHLLLMKIAKILATINTAKAIKSKPPHIVKSVLVKIAYKVKEITTAAVKAPAIKTV